MSGGLGIYGRRRYRGNEEEIRGKAVRTVCRSSPGQWNLALSDMPPEIKRLRGNKSLETLLNRTGEIFVKYA